MRIPNLMQHAKAIRKEGEPWQHAVSRARKELFDSEVMKALEDEDKKDLPKTKQPGESTADYFARKRKW